MVLGEKYYTTLNNELPLLWFKHEHELKELAEADLQNSLEKGLPLPPKAENYDNMYITIKKEWDNPKWKIIQ
jgi:hypothetical protein